MKSVDQRKTFISSFETQPGIIKKDNEKKGSEILNFERSVSLSPGLKAVFFCLVKYLLEALVGIPNLY
jgi:hypothetical protein